LSDGGKPLVLVACDLLCLNDFIVDRIRDEAGPGLELFISCSHTHAGPVAYADNRSPLLHREYIDSMIKAIVRAAKSAVVASVPARLGVAGAEAFIAENRREKTPDGKIIIGWNPGGPVDHSIGILKVESADGRPIAVVVNYACHGTILPPQNQLVSRDWIGAMRSGVEAAAGCPVLFLQGAAGDLNPKYEWGEGDPWEAVARLGSDVAGRVVEALSKDCREMACVPVRAERTEVWLPLEANALDAVPPKTYRSKVMKFAGLPGWLGFLTDFILDRRYPWKSRVEAKGGVWSIPLRVSALRVGDLGIVAFGAETFTEIGMEIKRASPLPYTFFSSLTDGCIGYLPTDTAHDEGGYEVDDGPYLNRYPARLAKGCAGIAITQAGAMLRRVGAG
jgi:hypothetical protein